jgi:hypothetical protein
VTLTLSSLTLIQGQGQIYDKKGVVMVTVMRSIGCGRHSWPSFGPILLQGNRFEWNLPFNLNWTNANSSSRPINVNEIFN